MRSATTARTNRANESIAKQRGHQKKPSEDWKRQEMGMIFGQRSGGGDRRSARSPGSRTSGFRLIAPETYDALSGNARNRRKYASEGPGAVGRQGTIAPRGNIRRLPANGSGGNAEFCPAWGLHPQFNPRAAGPEGRSRPERQVPRSKCRHPGPAEPGQPRCRCRAAG